MLTIEYPGCYTHTFSPDRTASTMKERNKNEEILGGRGKERKGEFSLDQCSFPLPSPRPQIFFDLFKFFFGFFLVFEDQAWLITLSGWFLFFPAVFLCK